MANTNSDDVEFKHFWLYTLRLEQGKYYVGITSKTPEARFKQHLNGFAGASWTSKYKPLDIFDRRDLGYTTVGKAKSYENKVVRKYIKKYGLSNVRGGDITSTDELIYRFGRIGPKDGWTAITAIVLLVLVMLIVAFYPRH